MTNYSERSLQLAAELRRQALQNLEQSKRGASDRSRAEERGNEARRRAK